MDDLSKTIPASVKVSAKDVRDLKRAAGLYSKRLGKRVGWTTFLRDWGVNGARREIAKAKQQAKLKAVPLMGVPAAV